MSNPFKGATNVDTNNNVIQGIEFLKWSFEGAEDREINQPAVMGMFWMLEAMSDALAEEKDQKRK